MNCWTVCPAGAGTAAPAAGGVPDLAAGTAGPAGVHRGKPTLLSDDPACPWAETAVGSPGAGVPKYAGQYCSQLSPKTLKGLPDVMGEALQRQQKNGVKLAQIVMEALINDTIDTTPQEIVQEIESAAVGVRTGVMLKLLMSEQGT